MTCTWPSTARMKLEAYSFTEAGFCALLRRSGVFEAFWLHQAKELTSCPGEGEYLKPEASPEYDLSNLAGPGVRGRSGRAPYTPRPILFLWKKRIQKTI